MSLQALRRYPLRTAMLLLAIAIGVAAVVLLTAVGEGARRYVTGQFSSLGTELLIVLPGRAETAGGGSVQGLLVGETARELTLDDTLALTRSPRIRTCHAARARRRHRVVAARASATSRCSARAHRCSRSSTGSWARAASCPKPISTGPHPVCVLGSTVARELFAERLAGRRMAANRRRRAAACSGCWRSKGSRAASTSTRR